MTQDRTDVECPKPVMGEEFCSARRQRTPSIAVAHKRDAKVRMKTNKPQQRPGGSSLVPTLPQVPQQQQHSLQDCVHNSAPSLPCRWALLQLGKVESIRVVPMRGLMSLRVNVPQQGKAGTAGEAFAGLFRA